MSPVPSVAVTYGTQPVHGPAAILCTAPATVR